MSTADVEGMASAMRAQGLKPKSVHNVLVFLHGVFEHATERGWTNDNPVHRATRPWRQRARGANPDLQFLTMSELEAVLRAIPDKPWGAFPLHRGRAGPAPPPPPTCSGRSCARWLLAAALSGLRRSELLGLRWRDVDWEPQRLRVRNAYVLGEHSSAGKSDLSMIHPDSLTKARRDAGLTQDELAERAAAISHTWLSSHQPGHEPGPLCADLATYIEPVRIARSNEPSTGNYSDSPTASRALLGSRNSRTRITLPLLNSTIQAIADSVMAPLSLPRPRR